MYGYRDNMMPMVFVVDTGATTSGGKRTSAPLGYLEDEGGVFLIDTFIEWGDGKVTTVKAGSSDTDQLIHDYDQSGVYTMRIWAKDMRQVRFVGSNPERAAIPHTQFFRETLVNIGPDGAETYSLPPVLTEPYSHFYDCSHLRSIPVGLFDLWTECTGFSNSFHGCSLISSIPENLFANCKAATGFQNCFSGLVKVTDIPADLFVGNPNAVDFSYCFDGCDGLREVPQNLFANNSKAQLFAGMFARCSNLVQVPSTLFKNNTEATSFYGTFMECPEIIAVPSDLFRTTTKVTNFAYVFNNCPRLITVPESLFDTTKSVEDFTHSFSYDAAITSSVPALWSKYPNTPTHAFTFMNCTNAANYSSIPASWR